MTRARFLLAVCLLALGPRATWAAASAWVGDARGAARLITAVEATGSGTRLDAALELRLAPGWHTYWRTPGDAGFPTTVDWGGSENLADATIAWPAPKRLTTEGLESFVYFDRVVLPLTLTLARPGEALRLRAEVDFASCAEVCIPYHASLDLALPAGLAAPGPEAPMIAQAESQVPGSLAGASLRLLSATVSGAGKNASLSVALTSDAGPLRALDLFVEGIAATTPPRPVVQSHVNGRSATLVIPLRAETTKAVTGHPLTFTVVDGKRSAEFMTSPTPGAIIESGMADLLAILGAALVGGLILNVMPCVLPVISLKLLSVAGYAGTERRCVRLGLLATASGVLASFLVIATALVGLKLAGAAVGWGIQFQQPWFLAAMAAAMTLFAASLWDLLPINLPGFAAGAANVRSKHAILDAFLAGAFATLMATSCSAPFVGTAVGFALARGPTEIVLVFAALGLGMAVPLLAIAAFPGLVSLLPRPGRWMVLLRHVLGFALAGTSAWLLWVLSQVTDITSSLIAGAALVLLVSALAFRSTFASIGRNVGTMAALAFAGMAVLVPSLAVPSASELAANDVRQASYWQRFDTDAIRRSVAAGKLVFVDVTAAWCLTCKVNEAAILDRAPVLDRLRAPDVAAMRADWTRPEPTVTSYIQSFGRFGIPLYVVYGPGRPEGEALPELLTTSAVMDALSRASGPRPNSLTQR